MPDPTALTARDGAGDGRLTTGSGPADDSAAPPRSVALARAGVVAAVLATVVAVVVGLAASGSAAAPALLDPGAAVRWGLPTTAALANLAAAVAVGALALLAVVLPPRSRAWGPLTVVASAGAGAWTLLSVVQLVLTYATIAGTAPDTPGFGQGLGMFATSITLGRILVTVTLLAAVTSVAALLLTTARGALLTGLAALAALAVRSQTGHAAGSVNHELAVSSMFLHLAGAALWVGGLLALAAVAHRLGPDLRTAVARFSPIAAWSLAAVGLSGVVNGALRVDGADDLGTTYGLLLVAKVVLLLAVGGIGLLHRRLVIARLPAAPAGGCAPALFWRLVAVELALMGAVTGVASALATTPPPVPQEPGGALTPAEIVTGHPLPPAPTVELWLTSFRWDLIPAAGCAAGLVVYLRWVRRLRRRGDRWPWARTASAVVGLVLLAWVTSGGPAVYGHVLFSAHMLQHMIMVMVVPIFLALCAPVTLAARALPRRQDGSRGPREWLLGTVHSRWAGFFANPMVAAVNFAGSMVVFYYTPAFEYALTTYIGHLLMIAHFTVAGYLFVNALVGVDPGPTRPAYPIRLMLLFGTMVFHAFFGVALVTQESLLVPEWFGLLGRPWGPSALEDQRAGGAIAWGISEVPMLVLAIVIAVIWTRDDERTARRQDRAADRDGDAELVAYNAMLARMADDDAGRGGSGTTGGASTTGGSGTAGGSSAPGSSTAGGSSGSPR